MADKIRISRRQNYKEQLRLYLNLTKRLNAKLKKLFRKQSIQASSQYAKGILDPDNFADSYSDELYKILANQYKTAITEGAERVVVQRYKKASASIDKIITDYVAINTAQKVTQISETTRKKLNATINRGLADGDSIKDVSRNIKNSDSFSTRRATLIARTETHSAMNAGSMEITKTLALNEPVKEWNSAMDERARYYHKSMDGTVVGINATFVVMTPTKYGVVPKHMRYTGDSSGGAANVCNCRCFTSYYDKDDEVIDAKPQKPVIAPDLTIPEELVVINPITPIKFVGFGRTTDIEKEFHNSSWNYSPEKYKQIPAKFKAIKVTETNAGCYFVDGKINMNKSRTGYNKSAVFVHEYGHFADREMWKTNMGKNTKFGKKIKAIKDADKRNRVDMGSLVYAEDVFKDSKKVAQNIKDNTYKLPSNLPSKNGATGVTNFRGEYQAKYGYDEATNTFTKLQTKQDVEIFLDDIFEDGVFFKKDEIKQLINFDKISDNAGKAFKYDDFIDAVDYKLSNKVGLIDSEDSFINLGVFSSLDTFVGSRSLIKKEVTINARRDIGSLADYIGSITVNKFGYGHNTGYYKKTQAKVRFGRNAVSSNSATEAFAEYLSLSASPQSELWRRKMTELAPNTKNGFDEMVDEILKMDNLN